MAGVKKKVLLIPWLKCHLDECTFDRQLKWLDKTVGTFVVRWKHMSSCEWNAHQDLKVPVAWAKTKGKLKCTDDCYFQKCKTNFRCALRSRGIQKIGRNSTENLYQFTGTVETISKRWCDQQSLLKEIQPIMDHDWEVTRETDNAEDRDTEVDICRDYYILNDAVMYNSEDLKKEDQNHTTESLNTKLYSEESPEVILSDNSGEFEDGGCPWLDFEDGYSDQNWSFEFETIASTL